jgi:hypothetical protein
MRMELRMPRRRAARLAGLTTLLLLPLASPAPAQIAAAGELPPIDAAARAAIVDSITAVIDSVYVLAEPARRIVSELRQNLAAGRYDELSDPAAFARRLYEDAQALNHDGHFQIAAFLPLDPSVEAPEKGEDPAEVERHERHLRATNYGFKKAEILPGGIGYLRFDNFGEGDAAFAAATAAMNFLATSRAVILDLRNNGGGSAAMIRYLCGYLFAEETHLINWDIRAEKTTVQSYSADYVPGKRLTEQPVYILTSRNTFSAAEEFTFDLRNHERATVVGDTTGGGGHTVDSRIFDFKSFRIGIRVPYGRAYNPKNNEGWEGKGVIPHIPVPAGAALDAAYAEALQTLLAPEKDAEVKSALEWALADVDGRRHPIALSAQQMKEYVGDYGPRRIFGESGALHYQREGRASHRLEPLAKDLFRVVDLDYFRLGFERDEKGRIVKIRGLYADGNSDEDARGGS